MYGQLRHEYAMSDTIQQPESQRPPRIQTGVARRWLGGLMSEWRWGADSGELLNGQGTQMHTSSQGHRPRAQPIPCQRPPLPNYTCFFLGGMGRGSSGNERQSGLSDHNRVKKSETCDRHPPP
jgi:hypothetical protein